MNPTEMKVQRFLCGQCQREHVREQTVVECCACETCGQAPATVNSRSYGSPEFCEPCFRKAARRRARDHVKRDEAHVDRMRENLKKAEARLAESKADLEKLSVKPKPVVAIELTDIQREALDAGKAKL